MIESDRCHKRLFLGGSRHRGIPQGRDVLTMLLTRRGLTWNTEAVMGGKHRKRRMTHPPSELSLAVIEDLKRQGYSQSDIARMYGYTRQYISWIKQYYGGRLTPREVVLQHFPFVVPAIMSQTSPYRRLRDHGEYMATGGVGMSEDKLKRLRTFYRQLRDENAVLEYDPTIPPIEGVSNKGGWRFVARVSDDGDLLIRVNEYTELTDEGKMIWRFPPVEP